MTYDQIRPITVTDIKTTIAQHGALRVLFAALGALFTLPPSRPPPPRLSDLDDRLRQDVGLLPKRAERPEVSLFIR